MDVERGAGHDVISRAEALAAAHPLRERFAALLMRALESGGRVPEALAVYERTRVYLADTLGTDPSAELRALHLALLREADEPSAPAPTGRTNLRESRTSFLGRSDETKRVHGLLDEGRLATVVGPGGAGKTRLAAVVAADYVDRLADGVWLVELAPVTDPSAVPAAVLGSLGVRATEVLDPGQERTAMASADRLIDVLAGSECLLVIDNCEHLVGAAADLVDRILAHCRGVRVLATSREPLGIDGEALCALAPLTLPESADGIEAALGYPSVQLFADRAAAARFTVDAQTVGSVVEIVRRLDGLPLAIELAAARLRVLPVDEIAHRLSDRFRLLAGGSRAALPRHRTLRAVVEWSWELLDDRERTLVECLAVFPSGASAEAAAAVAAAVGLSADEVPGLLDALVDKSLVQLEAGDGLRYRKLETIREYGVDRLTSQGRIDDVRRAHTRHFAALVAEAEPWLRRREQLIWLRRLERDHDNVIAALRYLGTSGDAAGAIRLATSLGFYWTLLGSHSEASSWLAFALAAGDGADPKARTVAEALQALNDLITGFADPDNPVRSAPPATADGGVDLRADSELERLDDIGRRLDGFELDPATDQMAIMLRPMLTFFSGDFDRINQLMERSLGWADEWTRATLLMFRANFAENEGNLDGMRADTAAALAQFTALGERWGLATTLATSAQLHVLAGELDSAVDEYHRAAGLLVDFGASTDLVGIRLRLAELRLRQGEPTAARAEMELARNTPMRGGPQTELMIETMAAALARRGGDAEDIRARRDRLGRLIVGLRATHPLNGHIRAITVASVAALDLALGDLAQAGERLREAHPTAVATRDMPVVAMVAAVTADWADRLGRPGDAAQIIGAAARLHGVLDETAPDLAALISRLQASLGVGYDAAFAAGHRLDRAGALVRVDPASVRASSVAAMPAGTGQARLR